jgi:hypothetical protein
VIGDRCALSKPRARRRACPRCLDKLDAGILTI